LYDPTSATSPHKITAAAIIPNRIQKLIAAASRGTVAMDLHLIDL
jgi:hypothetical protein